MKCKSNSSLTRVRATLDLTRFIHSAHMTFDHVFVADTQRLPKAEDFASGPNNCLFLTRVIAGWIAVGCAMGAYDTCLQYVKQRAQFGAPLASFQVSHVLCSLASH